MQIVQTVLFAIRVKVQTTLDGRVCFSTDGVCWLPLHLWQIGDALPMYSKAMPRVETSRRGRLSDDVVTGITRLRSY